jgi:hypothetical protein
MKTKYLLVYLLMMAIALKLKAENKLIFLPYTDNKYIVLDAKGETCGLIVGHKILDTVSIDKNVPDELWEECYLNPDRRLLVKKSTYYFYEKTFSFFQKIDSNQYVVKQGKKIKSFSVFVNKSGRRFNWYFLFPILIGIFMGYIATGEKKEYKEYYEKIYHKSYFDYFLLDHGSLGVLIMELFAVLIFIGLFSMVFLLLFGMRGEIYRSNSTRMDFFLLAMLITFSFILSFFIIHVIKAKNVKRKIENGNLG